MPSGDHFDGGGTVPRIVLPELLNRMTRPFMLEQISGPGAPRNHVLGAAEMLVGRAESADIAIPSEQISRRHMKLERQGIEFACVDLDSLNGIFLNGVKVYSAVLREGDQVQIGDVVFIYHVGA